MLDTFLLAATWPPAIVQGAALLVLVLTMWAAA
jgi:hypothetical protein